MDKILKESDIQVLSPDEQMLARVLKAEQLKAYIKQLSVRRLEEQALQVEIASIQDPAQQKELYGLLDKEVKTKLVSYNSFSIVITSELDRLAKKKK